MASGYSKGTTDRHLKGPRPLPGYGPRGRTAIQSHITKAHNRAGGHEAQISWSEGKEFAMRMVVMSRLAYTGQGANLSEAQIQRLDTVTLAYARKDL